MAMVLALFLAHPIDWALNNGVGQNLTAGMIVFALGFAWSRTKYWPLHALHEQFAALHLRLDLHEHLHEQHAAKLDRLIRAAPAAPEDGEAATPPSP